VSFSYIGFLLKQRGFSKDSTVALCRDTQAAHKLSPWHNGSFCEVQYGPYPQRRGACPVLTGVVSADFVYSSETGNNLLLFVQTGLNMKNIQARHVGKRYNL